MKHTTLLVLYFLSSTPEQAHSEPSTSLKIVQTKAGAGYAGAYYDDGWVHGFRIHGKIFTDIDTKDSLRNSTELSLRDLIKPASSYSEAADSHFFELGLTHGLGIYNSRKSSLEALLGVLRMGVTAKGTTFWTPYVGIGAEVKPFQLQLGASSQLRNNNNQGVQPSFNFGYSW